eukprot:c2058_g1_i1.p1 GENE.c2058_g1_i1~~c2058_g1_i1.p1  ORF type:complete len:483 (-),score=100.26 c2058_g1_i1:94-1542(-)
MSRTLVPAALLITCLPLLCLASGDFCSSADTGFSRTQLTLACPVGTFLQHRLPDYIRGGASEQYFWLRLGLFVSGLEEIQHLLVNASDMRCSPCFQNEPMYHELMAVRNTMTPEQLNHLDSTDFCELDLLERVLDQLPFHGGFLDPIDGAPFLTNTFHEILGVLQNLVHDPHYDEHSCETHHADVHLPTIGLQAFGWAALSAISFPIGAVVGRSLNLSHLVLGLLMGFGNGALLCALTVEMFGSSHNYFMELRARGQPLFAWLGLIFCLLGAVLGAVGFLKIKSFQDRNGGCMAWVNRVILKRQSNALRMSLTDARQLDHQDMQTAMGIWLGVALDALPEAVVIGIMVRQARISYGFLAAVFLANFPEAVSAAHMMRQKSRVYVICLWGIITVVTALIAAVVAWISKESICVGPVDWQHVLSEGVEGLAAGAMLSMLVCVAIPEAQEQAKDASGYAVLAGFLTIVLVICVTSDPHEDYFVCL